MTIKVQWVHESSPYFTLGSPVSGSEPREQEITAPAGDNHGCGIRPRSVRNFLLVIIVVPPSTNGRGGEG